MPTKQTRKPPIPPKKKKPEEREREREGEPTAIELGYTFNRVQPAALDWARNRAATLIEGVTKSIRDTVRTSIGDLFEGKATWDEVWEKLETVFDDEERVKTIAHTESMFAANEGQKQLWKQAVDDGYLNGDEHQVWIVTPDDKLCPICEEQEDMEVPLGQEFPTGGPPAHPNCRCTIGLL